MSKTRERKKIDCEKKIEGNKCVERINRKNIESQEEEEDGL